MDRTGKRQRWVVARLAESSYNTRLRQVAKQIDNIVRGIAPDGEVTDVDKMTTMLRNYAEILTPWAKSVASYMIADVARRNGRMWRSMSEEIGKAIAVEIQHAPTGMLYSALMDEQVALIKSLPLDAAKRIHEITGSALTSGRRAEDIAKEILASGQVSAGRARMIARTEVSRTAANFTEARARFAGSEGYIWRSSGDGDVRPTHRAMNGTYVRWDNPPKTDKGLAPYHAGCGPNCRCFAEPVLPDL